MLVTYFVNGLNNHLFGKELFIRFSASAFRKLPSIYVFSYFPFGFEGRMWDLIVSVPDHCLSFYHDIRRRPPVSIWTYNVWPCTSTSYYMDVQHFISGRPSVSLWTYDMTSVDVH